MWTILYLVSIIAANVITAKFAPIVLGDMIVPCGSFLIGATFVFRDFTQNQIGKSNTYKVIALALFLSGVTSYFLGDGLYIAFASLIAFLLSETSDTEMYSRLKMKMEYKVLYSGIVGGALDSVVFVVVGLSPIGLNVLSWNQVILAIIGQMVVKTVMQFIALLVIKAVQGRARRTY
ncbi:hypothetical protein COJ96_10785 [Bacillus sp. AFS073361]|uniref:VUT family protein n=1 Tax=Bacillus sp. AFS073361 TaxID=2033511 RepID=UPI000BF28ED1|nr:VUT family protein [Bacillus sp. AFS073361]PFP29381.1 hypothetical protein COJ96_10785 [Bacillus sp. AFS073361]